MIPLGLLFGTEGSTAEWNEKDLNEALPHNHNMILHTNQDTNARLYDDEKRTRNRLIPSYLSGTIHISMTKFSFSTSMLSFVLHCEGQTAGCTCIHDLSCLVIIGTLLRMSYMTI